MKHISPSDRVRICYVRRLNSSSSMFLTVTSIPFLSLTHTMSESTKLTQVVYIMRQIFCFALYNYAIHMPSIPFRYSFCSLPLISNGCEHKCMGTRGYEITSVRKASSALRILILREVYLYWHSSWLLSYSIIVQCPFRVYAVIVHSNCFMRSRLPTTLLPLPSPSHRIR